MLLPTKVQIQAEKSKERKLDIDQGLAFARKIDSLRETKELEMASLEKYRKDSSEALKKEIADAMAKRDVLISEVKELEEKRVIALKPLKEEWEKVEEREKQLTILERSLSEAFIKSEENKVFLFEKSKELAENIEKSKSDMREAKEAKEEALSDKKEAKKVLDDMVKKSNEMLFAIELTDKSSKYKEEQVRLRENNVAMREKGLDKRNLELNTKETKVNDKYQTLLRTIKRNNG